jgi:hypothetical protein
LAHDLCRAVAGDSTVALTSSSDFPRAEELDDKTHPQKTFHILDADSSQHTAIAAAVGGASLVLDGPPGTGKSQTIANVIAEFMAAGKTVLFVSEKAAALEVVQRRLTAKGLGDFVLACHSHKANKREIVGELGRCLNLGPEAYIDSGDELQRLYEARRQLNQYVHELHAVRQPLGKTVYQVHGELSRLARKDYLSRRSVPKILERGSAYLRKVEDLLARLPDCRSVIEEPGHPWRGRRAKVFSLTLRDDVCHHFGRLTADLGTLAAVNSVFANLGLGAVDPPRMQWQEVLDQVRAVLACPTVPAEWFKRDARSVGEAFIKLDNLALTYRRLVTTLPEFAPDAIRQLAEPLTLNDDLATGIVMRVGETLRGLCRRAATIAEALRKLKERALAIEKCVQQMVNMLHIRVAAPVRSLPRLAELAELLARTKTIRSSWWAAGRRKELLKVFARCKKDAKSAQESRAALADRVAPVAFAKESASIAIEAAWYNNFLKRLWPKWWGIKAEVVAWYIEGAPSTGELVDDLKTLVDYHKCTAYCRQARQQYVDDVLVDAEGHPAWTTTLSALESVDSLEEYGKIPSRIQRALSEEGELDRRSLGSAGRLLNQELSGLRKSMEAASQDYGFSDITEGSSKTIRLSAGEFVTWLEKQALAVAQLMSYRQKLAGLLTGGQDLPMDAIRARVKAISELVETTV